MSPNVLLILLLIFIGIPVAIVAAVFLFIPFFKGVAWLIKHIFTFVVGMLGDTLRLFGALITSLIYVPLVLVNIVIGRWSAARHFGRGLQDELIAAGHCAYRVVIGHPARLLLLSPLTEGIEQRIPDAIAQAPGSDRPSRRTGQFDGYTIVGSLPTGGSGGKLYIADPSEQKLAAFARAGNRDVDQVVIKSFSLRDGSTMPQIVRESRALEAARNLGLILDHELSDERFYYVMPYVPGENLTVVTKRLHAESGAAGLDHRRLRDALSHIADLLTALDYYHRGGLWHKDVKPDNIIVFNGKAHLVDLGLVTPLRSGMTLTTHGTEYFRDPELVRMALRGAKVHEVNGVKFDIYGAGAVLYSVIENSFPAHGALSQISKKCPEALRWVVRRAMTDMHQRYSSAAEMLADLRAIQDAPDPFALKPVDLPSMSGRNASAVSVIEPAPEPFVAPAPVAAHAGAPTAHAPRPDPARDDRGFVFDVNFGVGPGAGKGAAAGGAGRSRPRLHVSDWITGRYVVGGEAVAGSAARAPEGAGFQARRTPAAPARPVRARPVGIPAHEQRARAQARARAAQQRVRSRRSAHARYSNAPNAGVAAAVALFVMLCVVGVFFLLNQRRADRGTFFEMDMSGEHPFADVAVPPLAFASRDDASRAVIIDFSDIVQEVVRDVSGAADEVARAVGGSTTAATAEVHQLSATFSMIGGRAADGEAEDDAAAAQAGPDDAAMPEHPAILVVSFLPVDLGSESRTLLEQAAAALRERNFNVQGLEGSEQDIALLAGAKNAIKLDPSDNPEARRRLAAYITEQSPRIDAALWVPADASPWVFVFRSDLDPEVRRELAEEIRSTLEDCAGHE